MVKHPYIPPNKWYFDLINQGTFFIAKLLRANKEKGEEKKDLAPIFIGGLFRSGTSVTTELLKELGVDFGPENHLLKARGKRKEMNPRGFFENYLFMDWSLYAFDQLGAWGHIPPSKEKVGELSFGEDDVVPFIKSSLVTYHDDRISNLQKLKVLKEYSVLDLERYLNENFESPLAIKNPHFSVLGEYLVKKWPEAIFLACFRHPTACLKSCAQISSLINEEVYIRYYERLFELKENAKVIFWNYDQLMKSPEDSIQLLADKLGLGYRRGEEVIEKKYYRNLIDKDLVLSSRLEKIYSRLLDCSVN